MNILVTGGAGFVGTNLIKRLLKDGHNIVSLDNYSTGTEDNHQEGCKYVDADIRDVIDYKISDGYVDDIDENQSTNSLIFTLFDPGDDGVLSIKLSDEIMTPFEDGSFIVLIDDIESTYVIDDDTMNITFNSNNNTIEIFGTYVIPEFHEIAPLVLATSFIGLIVLKKYKKLFV